MLEILLKDHQTGMSKFQDDYFVTTRAGGTLYGQYKQALREVYKRFRGLRQQISDRRRLDIKIEELDYKIKLLENSDDPLDDFKRRKYIVDRDEKIMLTEESDRAIADTKREFINFYRQAVYLKEQIGELTEEKREQLDQEMWEFKVKEMACIDFITQGRLRNSTFEFIHACPDDMKKKVLREIKDHNNLLEWYENKENVYIPPKLDYIPAPDFKAIENFNISLEFKENN